MSAWQEPEQIGAAEAEVAKLAVEFAAWMGDYLAQARAALADAAGGGGPSPRNALFGAMHNVKGLGGSFGYMLVTDIAESLCADLRSRSQLDPLACSIAKSHLDAIEIVLKHKLMGDGGHAGAAVLARLRKLTAPTAAG